jgi:uncharacterized DUF497 family protein
MHFRIKPHLLRKIRDKHNIEAYEIYEVLEGRFLFTRVDKERYRVIGKCYGGRFLTMYLDRKRDCFELVTARESEYSEKRFYKREIE